MTAHKQQRIYNWLACAVSFALLFQMVLPGLIGRVSIVEAIESAAASSAAPAAAAARLAAAAPPSDPLEIGAPLSVSRAQSTATAAGAMVVTYTVRNNLQPVLRPDISAATTITDQVDALTTVDYAADPNVIRGVLLTDELTDAQTALQTAAPPADSSGDFLALNLGDIPPLGAATAVLTLTTPAAAADFAVLDSGAVAYGSHQGRAVSAAAANLVLAPDGFSAFLVCTIDANCQDRYITRKASELGGDPAAIFAFVRGLEYELYEGSLRGARGALWSEAGNAFDQASLLIALLRASGIPAAYRQGTLNTTNAQTLLASMFSTDPALGGYVPAGSETADPVNDPALIAEAQPHAWVEAYLPGSGWTAYDPAFPAANAGDTFTAPDGGQLAELPDSLRHKVTLQLKTERYGAFPVGGANLYTTYPLSTTLNTVELIGEPVVFAHLVESEELGGLTFASSEHTYIPYFVVGDEEVLVEGEAMLDLISNFPFGQDFVVAEWLLLTATDPSGNSETYERELFDDIGYEVRTIGGQVDQLERGSTARISEISSWSTLFSPSEIPIDAWEDMIQPVLETTLAANALQEQVEALGSPPYSAAEFELIQETTVQSGLASRAMQKLHLFRFSAISDFSHSYLAESTRVRAYPSAPRFFTVGWEQDNIDQTSEVTMDLGRNDLRAIPYPGQTDLGPWLFFQAQGWTDMSIEAEIVREIAIKPLISVGEIFDTAKTNGIEFERIESDNLDFLETMTISDEAKARITTAILANPNLAVIVPTAMVTLDGATEPTIGWVEMDVETGKTIDVMENGRHWAAAAYGFIMNKSKDWASFVGGYAGGIFSFGVGFAAGALKAAPSGDVAAIKAAAFKEAAASFSRAQKATKGIGSKDKTVGANLARATLMIYLSSYDPPIPEAMLNIPATPAATNPQATTTLTEAAALTGSTVNLNVSTDLVTAIGPVEENWTTTGRNNFAFDAIGGSGDLYQSSVLVGSGSISANPADAESLAILTTDGGDLDVSGDTDGSSAFHADALIDIGQGGTRDSYAVSLTPGASTTVTLTNATATLGGATYSGDLEIVTSSFITVTGSGATGAANFAAGSSYIPRGGGYMVADATGTGSIGIGAAPIANGFALGNPNGGGSITPAGAVDNFTFVGTADFFAVSLTDPTSLTDASTATGFDVDVEANFSGSYTVTVTAPEGWDVTIDASGLVSAQPPDGAAAGDYTILVSAQSQTHPDLFAGAEHVVTVTAVDGVLLDVAPNPLLTVPWGEQSTDVFTYDLNDGRMQLPDAAYTVWITNTSSVDRTFNVDLTGLPAGWPIFGAGYGGTTVQVSLEAGEAAQLDLYVKPTGSSLPPVGSSYPFNVAATATDNGAVTASDSDTFVIPATPFPFVTVDPELFYTTANSEVAFDVTVTNVGNAAGSFDLVSDLYMDDWSMSPLNTPVILNPGESDTQTVTVTVTTGKLGRGHSASVGAVAPTLPYTPTSASFIYVMGVNSGPMLSAANNFGGVCRADNGQLAAATEALALATAELEQWCDTGDCPLPLRDDVVDAAGAVSFTAGLISLGLSGIPAINAAAADLSAAGDDAAMLVALAGLSAAVSLLEGEVCEIAEHRVEAALTPYIDAVLLGDTGSFTLDLTNRGLVETTYAVTVTLPDGSQVFTPTIAPGATDSTVLNTTPGSLGYATITAEAAAIAPDVTGDIGDTAYARLNVVDRYIQLTAVKATPDFVETGVSSTTLSIDVANIANVPRDASARTQVRSAANSLLFDQDVPVSILAGSPRNYELAAVDTSGWNTGLYTVTVELLDAGNNLIPDGSGFGFLTVGEGLLGRVAVDPELTASGTVSVTTIITTEIKTQAIQSLAGDGTAGVVVESVEKIEWVTPAEDPSIPFNPPIDPSAVEPLEAAAGETLGDGAAADPGPAETAVDLGASAETGPGTFAPLATSIGGYTRYENDDAAIVYTGSWTAVNSAFASSGNTSRALSAGDSFSLAFTGEWVALGLVETTTSGGAEIFIDGISQGTIDTYSNGNDTATYVFTTTPGAHTVSVNVLGTKNANATSTRVFLDFIDTWDGTSLSDETVEAEDGRVFKSNNWLTRSDVAAATNGTHLNATADIPSMWFPFTGDSVSLDVIKRSAGSTAKLFVDGVFIDYIDLYSPTSITATFSFNGFGAGAHLLQVQRYRDWAGIDTFSQPGSAPFYTPPAVGDYHRFEEDDPAVLYNGVSFSDAPTSWSMPSAVAASSDYYARTAAAGDVITLTVNGTWINAGFLTDLWGGEAEILVDGISQGTIDLYSNEVGTANFIVDGLSAGSHTVTILALGTSNPFASDDRVQFDYLDVWNGTNLPDETVESDDDRVYKSGGWSPSSSAAASGGEYLFASLNDASLWFPFTGDSVSVTLFNYFRTEKTHILIDGQLMAAPEVYDSGEVTETLSFQGLGSGVHIMQVRDFRGYVTADTFAQPGSAPFYTPPAVGDYHRYEEDDPIFFYDGTSFEKAGRNWDYLTINPASSSWTAETAEAGRTISATVSGTWINLGFFTNRWSGQAEIFIDGLSQGIIDLYSREDDTASFIYDGLAPGSHTVLVTVLGTNNGLASDAQVYFDYLDVWNGTNLPDEPVESDGARVYPSGTWSASTNPTASGGEYLVSSTADSSLWFPFTGDSVSLTTFNYFRMDESHVYVDGRFVADLHLFNNGEITETFSFNDFGAGAHILQIKQYRGYVTADAFAQPGTAPFYTPPVQTGIIRIEEDRPGILYNGLPYTQTAQSWTRENFQMWEPSDSQVIRSSAASDTISFQFHGSWLGLGFFTDRFGGRAEIAIDGSPIETIDLYTRDDDTDSVYYDGLSAGSHTVTITVLGTANPNSSGTKVAFDFYDTWDGSSLADGTFEEDSSRLFLSQSFSLSSNAGASGGSYLTDGLTDGGTAWFTFEGDSVSFLPWGEFGAREYIARVDGEEIARPNRFALSAQTLTHSFDGFGPGPHVLEVRAYRLGGLTVDAFAQPALGPIYQPLTTTGIIRYEEDDPALRYNGDPFATRSQSWTRTDNINSGRASSGSYVTTSTAGDTIELPFDGTWVGVGFYGRTNTGDAEIFVDGISQGVVTTTVNTKSVSYYFDGFAPGAHTLTVEAVGQIQFDFIDAWDGAEMTDGWHDADPTEDTGRYHYSNSWGVGSFEYSYDDDYLAYSLINTNPQLWFTFTGDSFSFLYQERDNSEIQMSIDGVVQGIYDLSTKAPGFSVKADTIQITGLVDGPHVVQIDTLNTNARPDAFESDPAVIAPYNPHFEWYDLDPGTVYTGTGFGGSGLLSTVAVGDINNDGIVELIAPSNNGYVYAYRGDGVDAGGGTPELWRVPGLFAEPALADLDNDGKAEIILLGEPGLYVLEDDGTTKWFTDTAKYKSVTSGNLAWGGAAVGNVDGDPEPEIVINTTPTLANGGYTAVFDADGSLVWEQPLPSSHFPAPVALSDLTGDGILDVMSVVHNTATLYDVANNVIAWSYTYTDPVSANTTERGFGAPAIANLDAKQPGGDPEPEVIVNFEEWIYAFNHDGTVHWKYNTGIPVNYRPSHVTVADVDGDGELEVITAQANNAGFTVFDHTLFVLEADGTLKWSQNVRDETSSASGVATHDLNGDGVWEIIWNGSRDGLLIINGPDGERLFNEPFTGSGTVLDYPTVADVDGDGHGEIVLGGFNGIFVVGHDAFWGPARPLWNSHDYHITNINNDWSVPANEPPSWQVHNTYRTQTELTNPTPIYQVAVTYTHGLNGIAVAPSTASRPITLTAPLVTYGYDQPYYQPVMTTTFDSEVSDLQPGEVREVSSGTIVSYTLPSGSNLLTLPPLFVTAPHIATLDPLTRTAAAGTAVTYTLTLTNPAAAADIYTLTVDGLPAGWATLPLTVPLGADSSAAAVMTVTVPAESDPTTLPFFVIAANSSGGAEQVAGDLVVVDGLALTLAPQGETGVKTGAPVTFTLTITNGEPAGRTYDLAASGLAVVGGLPPTVTLGSLASTTLDLTATPAGGGPQPFAVTATAQENGVSASAAGVVTGIGDAAVSVAITPTLEVAGPGATAIFTPTVSNLGSAADTFDLTLDLPAGWSGELQENGAAIGSIDVQPFPLNSAPLRLLVVPAVGATPGGYPITLTAASQLEPSVTAVSTAAVTVLNVGVLVEILSGTSSAPADGSGTWQVRVTNTGGAADTFDLSAGGLLAGAAAFSANPVALAPGASQTVQLSAAGFNFALPGIYPLSVTAVSQTDDRISSEDATPVEITGHEAVQVAVYPSDQTVTATLTADFMLVITNTGSLATVYDFGFSGTGLSGDLGLSQINLPPHMTVMVPLEVTAPVSGTYPFNGSAASGGGTNDSGAGSLTVIACTPAPATNLTITVNGVNLDLSWDGTAAEYEVYRSTSAYSGYALIGTTSSTTYQDTPPPQLVGDTALNYFYEIRTTNACSGFTETSPRVAEFDYPLLPGD